jgi:hypothetical protein
MGDCPYIPNMKDCPYIKNIGSCTYLKKVCPFFLKKSSCLLLSKVRYNLVELWNLQNCFNNNYANNLMIIQSVYLILQ